MTLALANALWRSGGSREALDLLRRMPDPGGELTLRPRGTGDKAADPVAQRLIGTGHAGEAIRSMRKTQRPRQQGLTST